MRVGTWTVSKPTRKTPPSKDRGVAGSSGCVKRPHSDSSTPSLEKEQPKKPRSIPVQIVSYKEAVVGIKMGVIHRHQPEIKLDQTQVDLMQKKVLNAVDGKYLGDAPPQFLNSNFDREFSGSPVPKNLLNSG
jgi:hypothetical protein